MNIKACIYDGYKKADGKSSIVICLYVQRKRVIIKTGVSVSFDKWDPKNQIVLGTGKNTKDLNFIISNCKARANDIWVRYRLQHKTLTHAAFLKEYENPDYSNNFHDFIDKCIIERDGIIEPSTKKTYETLKSKLAKFKPILTFADVNGDLINDFIKYMKTVDKNNTNSIGKYLKVLKVFISIALRRKKLLEDPFVSIKISRAQPDRLYLEPEELQHLIDTYRKNHLHKNMQKVLNYYLFACFTGLRLSDVKNVDMDDIHSDIIIMTMQKTKRTQKVVKVPLTAIAKQMIKDAAPNRLHGKIFDPFADQVTNRYLKNIADACGINKPLSFHSARHTFATYFLRKTKNLAALQKLLGHSNIRETMVYAHIITDDLVNEMQVFNDFV